jgi:hypothetical protein
MPDSDGDWDPDTDSENVFPAALSGSYAKAPGFAGGYLLLGVDRKGSDRLRIFFPLILFVMGNLSRQETIC